MLRIFVVSPAPAVRAGLRALLAQAEDLQVAGEAAHLDSIPHGPFGGGLEGVDVVLVDAPRSVDGGELMPPSEGQPGSAGPGLVILGPVPGDERLPGDLAGKAWAYIPREPSLDQLVAAIRAVAGGMVAIHLGLGSHLLASGREAAAANEADGA